MTTSVTVPSGGVHFETSRNAYRGQVSVNGVLYRTKRFKSRRTAMRHLSLLRKQLISNLNRTRRSVR